MFEDATEKDPFKKQCSNIFINNYNLLLEDLGTTTETFTSIEYIEIDVRP